MVLANQPRPRFIDCDGDLGDHLLMVPYLMLIMLAD